MMNSLKAALIEYIQRDDASWNVVRKFIELDEMLMGRQPEAERKYFFARFKVKPSTNFDPVMYAMRYSDFYKMFCDAPLLPWIRVEDANRIVGENLSDQDYVITDAAIGSSWGCLKAAFADNYFKYDPA